MIFTIKLGRPKQGRKRGRQAAGKSPFVAAISRNEKGRPIHIRFSQVADFRSGEMIRWSEKSISHPAGSFYLMA